MNPESQYRSKSRYDVMIRVRTVRGVRSYVASPLVVGLCGVALVACMSVLVSLGDVFANTMAHVDWHERISYAFGSFFHSRFIVQTLGGLILSTSCIASINFMRKLPFRKIGMLFGSAQQV